jgi:hypothetical protein
MPLVQSNDAQRTNIRQVIQLQASPSPRLDLEETWEKGLSRDDVARGVVVREGDLTAVVL